MSYQEIFKAIGEAILGKTEEEVSQPALPPPQPEPPKESTSVKKMFPNGVNAVRLSDDAILDRITGQVAGDYNPYNNYKTIERIEIVLGLDEKKIDLRLVNDDGEQQANSGFLIEIYMSESDGLKKVYQKDTLDPQTGNVIKNGFEDYFILEVDK